MRDNETGGRRRVSYSQRIHTAVKAQGIWPVGSLGYSIAVLDRYLADGVITMREYERSRWHAERGL